MMPSDARPEADEVGCPDDGHGQAPPTIANGQWVGSDWIENGCTTCAAGNAATFHRHTNWTPRDAR